MKSEFITYIKNLQRASDDEKRLWLIVMSGIVMVIVITLWVFYLKMTIPGIAGNTQNVKTVGNSEDVGNASDEGESTYNILRNGLSNIGEELSRNIQKAKEQTSKGLEVIKKQVEKSNSYSFPGATSDDMIPQNTQPQMIEPIPPTELP